MAYSFRGESIIMVGHGSIQVNMVLKKELSILHLDLHAAEGVCLTGHSLNIGDRKVQPTVTHFLHQDHTYCNKATTPNSASPYGGHFLSNSHAVHGLQNKVPWISTYNQI